jgi:hypothetical protein
MTKYVCETENCGEEISEGCGTLGGLPICRKCRSVQYYWKRKGPKALAARRDSLEFFIGRIDYLTPHIGRLIKEAKAKVTAAHRGASSHIH